MSKIILLKYGELCLKGKNRKDFKSQLDSNLNFALKEFKLSINYFFDYILIESIKENELDKIKQIVTKIPGFSYLSEGYKVDRNIDSLKRNIKLNFNKGNFTFKVESKRSDKSFEFNSDEIKRDIGGYILSINKQAKVDLHNPDIKIQIEVKKDHIIYTYKKIKCTNGLPVGSSGKILLLLSGGIDSPVAAFNLMSRGFQVDFITFISPPYTSTKLVDKINMLVKQITNDYKLQFNTRLFICNYTPILNELNHIQKESYRITLLRRSFFRIASKLLDEYKYDAVATGEAIGQVASQTIQSMNCISASVNYLVLRPLLCFNKEQIIEIAKHIGTYEISILPYEDSCALFAPKNPITKPKLDICLELEQNLLLLNELESSLIKKLEVHEFKKNHSIK